MSYSRFKMLRKVVNGIPQDVYIQGDLIQAGSFNTFEECNEGNSSPGVTPDNPDMLYRWVASNEPWCQGTDEYKTEKQQQSSDSGKSWSDTGATRRGEFVRSYSFTCGFVAERWIEVNPTVDFICENGNKYYLQKKQISHDGVNWNDSGDTRKGPLIESQSSDCSYPQTRWVEIPIEIDYVCVGDSKYYKEKEQITNDGIVWQDTGNTRRGRGAEVHSTDCGYEPPKVITRWITVEGEFICQGTDKYQKEKEQISNDSGQTWTDTGNTRAGSLIEKNSYSCGYVSFRWVDVPNEYVCQGTDKYQKQKEEKTTDGKTWTPTGRERTGALIEKNSYSCGYVSYRWLTVEGEYVCQGYDRYTKEKEQSSTDGTQWQDTGRERAGSLIESQSQACGYVPPTPVQSEYLTFTALEGNSNVFNASNYDYVYYSFNKETWYSFPYCTSIHLSSGQKVYFKAGLSNNKGSDRIFHFSTSGRLAVSGNVMSMRYVDDFADKTDLDADSPFYNLFYECDAIVDITELILPATTLSNYCYDSMFEDCTGLTSIPSTLLPAAGLTNYCYESMFKGCTGLTSIPNTLLQATTLAEGCYETMFDGCTGLTSIPSTLLPAATLADNCYYGMFQNCTGLTSIPGTLLPATTLAKYCYKQMFENCSGLRTLPSELLPAMVLASYCYEDMFFNCTGLTSLPSGLLPAMNMKYYCYEGMFEGCTSLNSVPSNFLPATALESHCYNAMFRDCSSLATAPDLLADTLSDNSYTSMFANCTSLNSVKMLSTDMQHFHTGIRQWLYNVSQTGTFYKATGVSLPSGDSGIPIGWTVVEVTPPTIITRWIVVTDEYICEGFDKFAVEKEQVSVDGGEFIDTGYTRTGDLIESQSEECGYVPPVGDDYLSFTATETGTFSFTKAGLYYSLDKVVWTNLGKNTPTRTIHAGGTVYFKGKITPSSSSSSSYGIGTFSSTGNFIASGTPMSLLFGDDFNGQTSLSGKNYAFYRLFSSCTKLTSIDGLSLPAATLANYCYKQMFYLCTGLRTLPSELLPATTLADRCYVGMFYGCTGLTNVPNLPATTLADSCYQSMFYDCTSLTSIPSTLLPATTLADYCYKQMFYRCTGLTSVPNGLLPAAILTESCYEGMFYGCTGLTSVPSGLLPAATLKYKCYYEMFRDCSSFATAPDLLADRLASNCYAFMFHGCSSLNSIKMTATTTSATNSLQSWVYGVASSGTFYKAAGKTLPTGVSGIPSGWTVVEV